MVENERPRTGCLTVFLVLMILGGLLGAVQYLAMGALMRRNFEMIGMAAPPGWYFPVMGVLSLLNVAAAVGMWQWKRWGVYLYVGLSLVSILLSLVAGFSPVMIIITSAIGLAILYFLVRPLWDRFE